MLFRSSLVFLLLTYSLCGLSQNRVTSAAYYTYVGSNKLIVHFYALDGVLSTAQLSADVMKQPIKFRIEKRTLNGFSMSSALGESSRNRMIIEITNGDVTMRDADSKQIGKLSWLYDGPIDGRGTGCENCLNEDESFGLLRRARALKE